MTRKNDSTAKPDVQTGGSAVQTNGGAYIGGNVSVGDNSKFVGRDDNSTSGASAEQIAQLFQAIYKQIDAKPELKPEDKQDLHADVHDVQTEVAKGDQADESFLERRLRNIQRMAPDILDVIVTTFADPALGLAKVVQKVMAKAKATN